MKIVTAKQAVEAIEDGTKVIFPSACANPTAFFDAFSENVERFSELTVCSAMSLGDYRFLNKGLGEHFHYLTWQSSVSIRHLFKDPDRKQVSFAPIRLGDLTRVVRRGGPIHPDAVVVQTSVPQDDGTVSLGISVGANPHFINEASLVIAEMNTNMPVTSARVKLEDIDYACESSAPLAVYDTGEPQARDQQIIDNVLSLIPEGAWVQFGVGAVPDRVLGRLAEIKGTNLFSGMLTQSLVNYLEGVIHEPTVINGELAGNQTLYDYCNRNQRIEMVGLDVTHDPGKLASLDNFVSINSAVEIDLMGQSNGETLGDVQISGVGGSLDYIEAAAVSEGGVSIIAMPSTTAGDKRSKIVASLAPGSAVTTPRYVIDYVITEYGIARLRGKTLWERAEAMIEIAHPKFRDELANSV
ncbi:MAG: acetyl-CoA hydrolase/transferase C-terminal domain-containing protein [Pseudomonadota bacterium]